MKKCLGRSLLNIEELMDAHMKDDTYSQDALVCVHIVHVCCFIPLPPLIFKTLLKQECTQVHNIPHVGIMEVLNSFTCSYCHDYIPGKLVLLICFCSLVPIVSAVGTARSKTLFCCECCCGLSHCF